MYVESRTEITFLADGPGMAMREGGANTVLANLPIPKINEVYYFEAKIYEKPPATEIAVGLATKPYPSFRMPGWNRISVGYFSSDGFKCHNYPFTAASYGPSLNEGDVLGVGYRPRTGTVFFTKNGRKLEDCYTGLSAFNMFPAVGSNGAATVHVNLGQAGFVFIEANVKKWGLAPMVGTLAPPPAYGSERGSILLDAGYGVPGASHIDTVGSMARRLIESGTPASSTGNRTGESTTPAYGSQPIPGTGNIARHLGRRRTSSRRDRRVGGSLGGNEFSLPNHPSPLREAEIESVNGQDTEARSVSAQSIQQPRYHSPTDQPELTRTFPSVVGEEDEAASYEDYHSTRSHRTISSGASVSSTAQSPSEERNRYTAYHDDADDTIDGTPEGEMYDGSRHSPGGSPLPHNPPTPNVLDISLRSLHRHQESPAYFGGRANRTQMDSSANAARSEERRRRRAARQPDNARNDGLEARLQALVSGVFGQQSDQPPPGYSPLDPNVYSREFVCFAIVLR